MPERRYCIVSFFPLLLQPEPATSRYTKGDQIRCRAFVVGYLTEINCGKFRQV